MLNKIRDLDHKFTTLLCTQQQLISRERLALSKTAAQPDPSTGPKTSATVRRF